MAGHSDAGSNKPYEFREADALGERSNLDFFVDPTSRIVWLRKGLSPKQERAAAFHAGRLVQQEPMTITDVPPRTIRVSEDVN